MASDKQQPAPMSDEQLQQIRDDVSLALVAANAHQSFMLLQMAGKHVPALLAEVERLRAREAAAMKIVQAVANMDAMPENSDGWQECVFRCGAGELGKYHHATDCPYTLARQLAGSEGNSND